MPTKETGHFMYRLKNFRRKGGFWGASAPGVEDTAVIYLSNDLPGYLEKRGVRVRTAFIPPLTRGTEFCIGTENRVGEDVIREMMSSYDMELGRVTESARVQDATPQGSPYGKPFWRTVTTWERADFEPEKASSG
jgi:hypothetical protein